MNFNNYDNQYSTTSYGAMGGAGGGGFMNQYGSQGEDGGSATKTHGKETLRPVTIKQVLEAQQPHPDAEFKIDGSEITTITFVGQIRNISSQTTNITYKLDDGTGTVEVKQWVDGDPNDSDNLTGLSKPKLVEDAYARVWGKLKAFNNRRHVGAQMIRPISDYNEVQYHLLEATAVHLYFVQGPPEQLANGGSNGVNGTHDQQTGAYGATNGQGQSLPGLTGPARRVYNALRESPQSNEGLHIQNLAALLGMPVTDVQKAGDELLSNGIIYTTVDDDTWAVLEM